MGQLSTITDKQTEEEKQLKEDLIKLLSYYENIFNQTQIEGLILFWYGHTPHEVSTKLKVEHSLISTWLSDRVFLEAIKAGENRRKELINIRLEKLSNRALEVVENTLSHDIKPTERGFKEYITTARWLVDKTAILDKEKDRDDEERKVSRIDRETLEILAEEMRRVNPDSIPSDIRVEDLYLNDVVEAEAVNLSDYYNVVDSKRVMVSYGVVNVYSPSVNSGEDDEEENMEIKFQCHLCGKWFSSLTGHIARRSHEGISSEIYKNHFGLPKTLPLAVDDRVLEMLEGKLKR